MNKYQDALLSFAIGTAIESDYTLLQELVDRATPEKPTEELIEVYCGEIPSEKELHYFCSQCGMFVGCESEFHPFCSQCGQAIDWGKHD